MYPAWTVTNPEDVKMANRVISPNAVPIVYSVKTSIRDKSQMILHSRDIMSDGGVSLLVDSSDAIDYLIENYDYHKIKDEDLRSRMLNPYVQTALLINEAINLEQVTVQGYLSVKEKPRRRKDRVMAFVYGLWYANQLEEQLGVKEDYNLLDYIISL